MHSNTFISGLFLPSGCAEAFSAHVRFDDENRVYLKLDDNQSLNEQYSGCCVELGAKIPGLPVDILFSDGAVFTPDDQNVVWPNQSTGQSLASFLESNLLIVAVSAILAPLIIWWLIAVGIPKGALHSVPLIPDSVPNEMGREVFAVMEKFAFEPSVLSTDKKDKITKQWLNTLNQLSLPTEKYQLHFRASKRFGANALALPDGKVVITDDLVLALSDNPNAILAVLLHEIGHVEHKHTLKMVAQSVATSLFFSVYFGDIEGAGEVIIGASSSLLQNAFSREMESDADEFAFKYLKELGIPTSAFADALEAIVRSSEKHSAEKEDVKVSDDGSVDLLQYLSSHPKTAERIKNARQRDK